MTTEAKAEPGGNTFDDAIKRLDRHGIDLRTAAYAHALTRIGQAIEAVGTQSYFQGGR